MNETAKFAIKTGTQLAKAGCQIIDFKSNAHRAMRRTRYAAEDFVDEMSLTVRRQPLKFVGMALGIGVGIGFAAGWIGKRN